MSQRNSSPSQGISALRITQESVGATVGTVVLTSEEMTTDDH